MEREPHSQRQANDYPQWLRRSRFRSKKKVWTSFIKWLEISCKL